jgi:chromosome segregation ATPase
MESLLTTTYEIRNKGLQRKTVIVEHPRQGDRKVKDTQPWETTDGFYRFRVPMTSGQMTELPIIDVVSRQNTETLQSLNRAQLVMFSGKETPQNIRTRLGEIVDTQEQLAAMRTELSATENSITTLFRDQERLRENIKALRDTREEQELRTRYLDQLKRQEDQMDASRGRIDAINKAITTTENKLSDLISNLSWGN